PLLGYKNDEIRERTLRALGRIGDPAAVQSLIQALNDPVPFVRWGATVGLGFLGRPEAIKPLISLALCDGDRNLRWRAVEALGDIGNKRAVRPLRRIFENKNEDPDVRTAAAIALNKIMGNKTS
ncbi:MAG: HEAT repeat domain-containing protein, partial [Candidatus Hodarchaeota archaeon]